MHRPLQDIRLKLGLLATGFLALVFLSIFSFQGMVKLPVHKTQPAPTITRDDSVPQNGSRWVFELHGEARPLPDIILTSPQGQTTDLKAFTGDLVLLNIWATWCLPCIEELPGMRDLAQQFSRSSFALIALSIDRNPESRVPAFLERHALTDLPIYYDSALSASQELGITTIPTTLIIDPMGREIARIKGPFDWNDKIARELIDAFLVAP